VSAPRTDGVKLTPWFNEKVKPVRKGVYEIAAGRAQRYSYWNGKRWGFREPTVYTANLYRRSEAYGPIVRWRGLARKP
jgi:hypothetical protein